MSSAMNYQLEDNGERRSCVKEARRVVLKVGSNLVREQPAVRTAALIEQIARLRKAGKEVILVTSGAIPLGMGVIGRKNRPKELSKRQALAAIGQCHLIRHYEDACEKHGFHCAQLLLTNADLHDRQRNVHVANCLRALLEDDVLPIINENDSVTVEQIRIGDNDTLAAYVASMLNADLAVLLTTVDGFHLTRGDGVLGDRISVVRNVDRQLLAMAGSTDGNQFSTGGMITKLHAASICMSSGLSMAIIDGHDFGRLGEFFAGADVGTLFVRPGLAHPMHAWQRFLAFFSEPAGDLIIDDGAAEAITRRHKSLLPGGMLGISGTFQKGDTVRLLNSARTELARGVVNFSYDQAARICGARSSDLPGILGYAVDSPEVVHKDYLVLLDG